MTTEKTEYAKDRKREASQSNQSGPLLKIYFSPIKGQVCIALQMKNQAIILYYQKYGLNYHLWSVISWTGDSVTTLAYHLYRNITCTKPKHVLNPTTCTGSLPVLEYNKEKPQNTLDHHLHYLTTCASPQHHWPRTHPGPPPVQAHHITGLQPVLAHHITGLEPVLGYHLY